MRSTFTRRHLLLGALALSWFGHGKAALRAPKQPLVFLSSELQPLRLAAGDGRIFADIKKLEEAFDAAFREVHMAAADGLAQRWREWCATRQFHPEGGAKR